MSTKPIPEDCVVFDTETTGFDPETGDRLVEIGAVRMRGGLPTDETYHTFINPERSVPQSAVEVHGLTTAFLADKPLFSEVVDGFLAWVSDDPLVAHNAPFDAKFINHQMAELGLPIFNVDRFTDTVQVARKQFPGTQVNLDALCRRFKISLASRHKHGALIDSELLAEVCVELNGGRQSSLFDSDDASNAAQVVEVSASGALSTFVLRATDDERARHAGMLTKLGSGALWTKILEENVA